MVGVGDRHPTEAVAHRDVGALDEAEVVDVEALGRVLVGDPEGEQRDVGDHAGDSPPGPVPGGFSGIATSGRVPSPRGTARSESPCISTKQPGIRGGPVRAQRAWYSEGLQPTRRRKRLENEPSPE